MRTRLIIVDLKEFTTQIQVFRDDGLNRDSKSSKRIEGFSEEGR